MKAKAFFGKYPTRWFTLALLTAAFSVSHVSTVQAQSALVPATIRLSPDDLERGSYGHQQNFFFLAPGKTGENYQSAGLFGQKLRPYLSGSPTAVTELNSYRRQKTLFLIDKGLLLGSVGLYASQVFSHTDQVYFNTTQQAAAGVAVVSLVATLFINRHTNDYLKQAVDNYNADLPAARQGALWPRLRPTGLGLATTAQGLPLVALRWQL